MATKFKATKPWYTVSSSMMIILISSDFTNDSCSRNQAYYFVRFKFRLFDDCTDLRHTNELELFCKLKCNNMN